MTSGGPNFVVGPTGAPAVLELVALLGAGGEGEVWRARVRMSCPLGEVGDDVAVKVARHDPSDPRWPSLAELLPKLAHPGLVKVRAVFTGPERHPLDESKSGATHRYIVMDYEPGLTLSQWAHENPDASRAKRGQLLRQVAAALDALHAGMVNGEPVAHGDVKPSNIIVRPDRSTVLVDLGLSRSTSSQGAVGHTTAYTAPEFSSGATQATPEADAYAFVVTTAQMLTGRPLPVRPDGYLSVPAVVQQLRSGDATRRHALVTRHITRTLKAPPEARPGQLASWLRRPRRQMYGAASVCAVTLLILSIAALAWPAGPGRSVAEPVAKPLSTPSPSLGIDAIDATQSTRAGAPAAPTRHRHSSSAVVLAADLVSGHVSWSIPDLPCDPTVEFGAVAGIHSLPAVPKNNMDARATLLGRPDAGAWGEGDLAMRFSVSGRGNVDLLRLAVVPVQTIQSARWIYQPSRFQLQTDPRVQGVCGASSGPPAGGPRIYSFVDRWRPDAGTNVVSRGRVSSNSSRPRFRDVVLRPTDGLNIDIDALACHAGYSFQAVVTWKVDGSTRVQATKSRVFAIYGYADGASLYQTYYTPTGGGGVQKTSFTGRSVEGCGRTGGDFPSISPWPTPAAPSSPPPPSSSGVAPSTSDNPTP